VQLIIQESRRLLETLPDFLFVVFFLALAAINTSHGHYLRARYNIFSNYNLQQQQQQQQQQEHSERKLRHGRCIVAKHRIKYPIC